MSFAYLPLFTGDYLRDTQHLSCSEHGIFLKLLMHCWDQKGPAPLLEEERHAEPRALVVQRVDPLSFNGPRCLAAVMVQPSQSRATI